MSNARSIVSYCLGKFKNIFSIYFQLNTADSYKIELFIKSNENALNIKQIDAHKFYQLRLYFKIALVYGRTDKFFHNFYGQ